MLQFCFLVSSRLPKQSRLPRASSPKVLEHQRSLPPRCRAQRWEHQESLAAACPMVDEEPDSCLRGADATLKPAGPPEATGTGGLECEGSLVSSGALGKRRPGVEETLGAVTKPIGGKARASGDSSDSRLPWASPWQMPKAQLLADSSGTARHVRPHPAPHTRAPPPTQESPGQSPPWRRGSQLGRSLSCTANPWTLMSGK